MKKTTPAGANSRKGDVDVVSSTNSRRGTSSKISLKLGPLKQGGKKLSSVASDYEGSASTLN